MFKIAAVTLWFLTGNGTSVKLVTYSVSDMGYMTAEKAEEACELTKTYMSKQRINDGYRSQSEYLSCVPEYYVPSAGQ